MHMLTMEPGSSVKIGDFVLFIPLNPLPVPRGKLRMWDIGKVISFSGRFVQVVDLIGFSHTVYSHQVRLLLSDF